MTQPIHRSSEPGTVGVAEAATLLGVSTLHVQRLIDRGLLPHFTAPSGERITAADLVAYVRNVDRRHAALNQLAAEAQEMGLYNGPLTGFVR